MRKLYILWFAFLGADRIDLFGGQVNFIVTPFLILSLLIILAWVFLNSIQAKPISIGIFKNGPFLYILIASLLIVTCTSILLGNGVGIGAKRFALLFFQIGISVILLSLILSNKDSKRILIKGAYLAIGINLLFSIVQYLIWFKSGFIQSIASTLYPYIKLHSSVFSHFAVRPSGYSLDPNRGSLLLICYSFIIYIFDNHSFKKTAVLWIASILVLLSLSKSSIISLFIFVSILFIQKTGKMRYISKLSLYLILFFVVISLNYSRVNDILTQFQVSEIIVQRLSIDSGSSAAIHLAYIERGFDVLSSSIKNFFFGIGYSNARSVLMDLDSTYYSNFHSIYITFLAEVGIIGFVLIMMIHFIPLFYAKKYIPIILALGFFNIFYQLSSEPLFWIILIMAWYNYGFKKRRSGTIPIIFKT
jgi:hypothetical protein